MAGPVTNPAQVDPSMRPNYHAGVERYQKLTDLASTKVDQTRALRDDAVAAQRDARDVAREAQKSADSAAETMDTLDASARSIREVMAHRATQIDQAKTAGQDTSALEAQQAQSQDELTRTEASMEDYRPTQEASQSWYESKLKELTDADGKVASANADLGKYQTALQNYESNLKSFTNADESQKIATIAQGGDADATRAAVYGEADRVNAHLHDVADRQATAFEDLKRAQTDQQTLKSELDISERDQARLEAEFKKVEVDGPPDKLGQVMQDLQARQQRTSDLRDRITDNDAKVTELDHSNRMLETDRKNAQDEVARLRQIADASPDQVADHFLQREQNNGDLAVISAQDTDMQNVAQELDPTTTTDPGADQTPTDIGPATPGQTPVDPATNIDGPVTSPSQVSDNADTNNDTTSDIDGLASNDGTGTTDTTPTAATDATDTAPTIVDDSMLQPSQVADSSPGVPDDTTGVDTFPTDDAATQDATATDDGGIAYQEPDPVQAPEPEVEDYTPPPDTSDSGDSGGTVDDVDSFADS